MLPTNFKLTSFSGDIIDPTVIPVVDPPRDIRFSLFDRLKKELERMLSLVLFRRSLSPVNRSVHFTSLG